MFSHRRSNASPTRTTLRLGTANSRLYPLWGPLVPSVRSGCSILQARHDLLKHNPSSISISLHGELITAGLEHYRCVLLCLCSSPSLMNSYLVVVLKSWPSDLSFTIHNSRSKLKTRNALPVPFPSTSTVSGRHREHERVNLLE